MDASKSSSNKEPTTGSVLDINVLAESSGRWMRAGLEAFSRQAGAHDFAVHHCVVALEHLLKAYLTSLHPALIVEGRDVESLLHATGYGHHATVPVTRIKTIGLAEALTRVERFLRPQIAVGNRERGQVLAARNGVAHGGLHDPAEVEAVLATCVRVADSLLGVLGTPTRQTYWGHYRDLRDRLAEEHANSMRIRYESKLTHARHAYRRRFDGVAASEENPRSWQHLRFECTHRTTSLRVPVPLVAKWDCLQERPTTPEQGRWKATAVRMPSRSTSFRTRSTVLSVVCPSKASKNSN